MKAIIFAAGEGKRMGGLLEGKPKSLIKFGGVSLLVRSLKYLSENKIDEVIVVTGFGGEHIREELEGKDFGNMKIFLVENEIWNKTSSMHSFYLGIKSPQDCLALDADIIYDPSIIGELLNFEKENVMVLAKASGSGDELFADLEGIEIKQLSKELGAGEYESVGISKLSKDFVKKILDLHKENLINNNKIDEHFEYCAQRASEFIPWHGLIREDLAWSEIDRPEDLERAKKAFFRIDKS